MSYRSERLEALYAAEKTILEGGQSYRIGNRTLTRANLADIQDEIARLEAAGVRSEDQYTSQTRRSRHVIFHE